MAALIRTLLIVLTFCFLGTSFAANSLKQPIETLTNYIEELIKKKKIPGCAVAIIDHDRIVFMKAFGVQKLRKGKKSEKINLDTIFQLGSISKPITATLIAILQKRGQLNIDYKLTDDGKLRVKAFNRANDGNVLDIQKGLYTQGVGIFYRQEFETFGDLIRKVFRKSNHK